MTYSKLFSDCIEQLNTAGIEEPESDVRLLFQYLLDADRGFMFMHGTDEVDKDKADKVLNAVQIRKKRVPLQHITGYQNFMGLEFRVTKDVLIPRFDTECLVEEAMLICDDGAKVLDLCTGSGCILISLMNYKNGIDGYGVDISEAALKIAEENAAELCKQNTQPKFIISDLYDELGERDFDLIVSNPPYIRTDVIDTLMTEVKDYDPFIALDGGEDGLTFYRRIVEKAPEYLRKNGFLLVEIGYDQGEEVKTLFEENGFNSVRVIKDLAGNDRVVSGRI